MPDEPIIGGGVGAFPGEEVVDPYDPTTLDAFDGDVVSWFNINLLAGTDEMATIGLGVFQALNNRNYQPGTYTFPAVNLTGEPGRALLSLNRETWANFDATIELIVEYSADGVAWRNIGGLKSQCGPVTNPDGTPANFISSDFFIPNVGSLTRQLRGTMILSNQTKRTDLTITLTAS